MSSPEIYSPVLLPLVEGIMTLTDPGLRDLYDLKVFVVCIRSLRSYRIGFKLIEWSWT